MKHFCGIQQNAFKNHLYSFSPRHNNGHVTRGQFRQCLTMVELNATEDEMKALEAKFCNDTGFNYLAFLEELQPVVKPDLMYIKRLEELRLTNAKSKLPERGVGADLETVLNKIKTMVSGINVVKCSVEDRLLYRGVVPGRYRMRY